MFYEVLHKIGFQLRLSAILSDCSIHSATTTALIWVC